MQPQGGIYFSLQFEGIQSIMAGKARWQECDTAGQIVFVVREQQNRSATGL